jgi:hypothetical protein
MIRLNLEKQPYWLDVADGVRLRVAPLTSAIMAAASTAPAMRALSDDVSPDMRFFTLTVEVAKLAILEWEGVGDADGKVIEPSPEWIEALMDNYVIARKFSAEYVTRGLLVSAEKNA